MGQPINVVAYRVQLYNSFLPTSTSPDLVFEQPVYYGRIEGIAKTAGEDILECDYLTGWLLSCMHK